MAGNDNYTKLLLHMDDAGLTDNSPSAHTITQNESISRSATQSKFGGYSANMSPGWFSLAHHSDWDVGSGDFTVDLWFYATVNPVLHTLIGNASDPGYFGCILQNGPKATYHVCISPGSWLIAAAGSHTISPNQWYHFAMVRNSGNFRGYINGELDYSSDLLGGSAIYYPSNGFRIGEWSNGTATWQGYMDEVRFSKGIARWTAPFTPPEYPYDANPNYEIAGTLSEEARIYVIDEASGEIFYDSVESAGSYSVPMPYATEKTVIAVRESDGKAITYGRVIPSAV